MSGHMGPSLRPLPPPEGYGQDGQATSPRAPLPTQSFLAQRHLGPSSGLGMGSPIISPRSHGQTQTGTETPSQSQSQGQDQGQSQSQSQATASLRGQSPRRIPVGEGVDAQTSLEAVVPGISKNSSVQPSLSSPTPSLRTRSVKFAPSLDGPELGKKKEEELAAPRVRITRSDSSQFSSSGWLWTCNSAIKDVDSSSDIPKLEKRLLECLSKGASSASDGSKRASVEEQIARLNAVLNAERAAWNRLDTIVGKSEEVRLPIEGCHAKRPEDSKSWSCRELTMPNHASGSTPSTDDGTMLRLEKAEETIAELSFQNEMLQEQIEASATKRNRRRTSSLEALSKHFTPSMNMAARWAASRAHEHLEFAAKNMELESEQAQATASRNRASVLGFELRDEQRLKDNAEFAACEAAYDSEVMKEGSVALRKSLKMISEQAQHEDKLLQELWTELSAAQDEIEDLRDELGAHQDHIRHRTSRSVLHGLLKNLEVSCDNCREEANAAVEQVADKLVSHFTPPAEIMARVRFLSALQGGSKNAASSFSSFSATATRTAPTAATASTTTAGTTTASLRTGTEGPTRSKPGSPV